jgi:hypothetical protein
VDGWDFLLTVPAHGESFYQCVAPTLCDSTADEGICWSVFFIRTMTPDPLLFFDSKPDSGYSVDNLAPAAPRNLAWNSPAILSWDEAEEPDFNYFTVYGSDNGVLDENAVLIGHTTGTSIDLAGAQDIHQYYFVTATDFSGNEGDPATLQVPADAADGAYLPATLALHPSVPNPFTGKTTLVFDLHRSCTARLTIFDPAGRLVRTLIDGPLSAGSHKIAWSATGKDDKRVPPGIYLARLQAAGIEATQRLVILK